MTKASNLSLWNKVNVTSPEYTKQANNGRYKFTCSAAKKTRCQPA